MSSVPSSSLRFKIGAFAEHHSAYTSSGLVNDGRGNAWRLQITSGGGSLREPVDDPFVGFFLQNEGKHGVSAAYSIILRDADGRARLEKHDGMKLFHVGGNRGFVHFLKRSDILGKGSNVLLRGTLHVDVHLRFKPDRSPSLTSPSSLAIRMLRLLESEEGADVRFKVRDTTFPAHKLILRTSASILLDFCKENDDGSPIAINITTPPIFRILLRYIYAEEVPDAKTMTANAKNILHAADRFGLVGLKLLAETALVESLVIHMENFADWLIFADSKTCPLLKECAMAYFVDRSEDILSSGLPYILEQSPKLLLELMRKLSRILSDDHRFGDEGNLSVIELRWQLHEQGLDIDGSKEVLVSRLEGCRKRRRTDGGDH